jgi:hypothetical protein
VERGLSGARKQQADGGRVPKHVLGAQVPPEARTE